MNSRVNFHFNTRHFPWTQLRRWNGMGLALKTSCYWGERHCRSWCCHYWLYNLSSLPILLQVTESAWFLVPVFPVSSEESWQMQDCLGDLVLLCQGLVKVWACDPDTKESLRWYPEACLFLHKKKAFWPLFLPKGPILWSHDAGRHGGHLEATGETWQANWQW